MSEPAEVLSDPAREVVTAELVPLRAGDIRVKRCVDILIARHDYAESRAEIHAELMAEWGISKNGLEQHFTEAGRFLRIQRVPELLLEQGLAELRAIAASTAEDAPAVAVAAWKTILDRIEGLVTRAEKRGHGAAVGGDATAILRAGSPELDEAIKTHWAPGAVRRGVLTREDVEMWEKEP